MREIFGHHLHEVMNNEIGWGFFVGGMVYLRTGIIKEKEKLLWIRACGVETLVFMRVEFVNNIFIFFWVIFTTDKIFWVLLHDDGCLFNTKGDLL